MVRERPQVSVFGLAVLIVCALVLMPTLTYRMGVDQGVFAYMGTELLNGRWPYVGTWESDFPGMVFLHAAELGLLGKSIVLFRLFDLLYQLGNVSDAAAEENVKPGDVKVLRPETSIAQVDVTDEKGKRLPVPRGSSMEFAFKGTDEVGVYAATWPGGSRKFTVNLLDAEESNTQPRDEIKLGEQEIVAGGEQRRTYETWKWVALGALVLLFLEWAMYHQRAWF